MKLFSLLPICILTNIISASSVYDYGDNDFPRYIATFDIALVLFYAPWCRHCQKLQPIFEKSAEVLNRNDPPVSLVRVNCDEYKEVCNKDDVTEYPTLKIFRKGYETQKYKGPKDEIGLIDYMRSKALLSMPLVSQPDLHWFLSQGKDPSLVGFFKEDTILKDIYFKLTQYYDNIQFAHMSDGILREERVSNNIVIFRPEYLHSSFEKHYLIYTGRETLEDVKKFIDENKHGLVGHRKENNKNEFKYPLVIAYFNIDYDWNPKLTNYYRTRILNVARHYKKKFNFAMCSKTEFEKELNEFGVAPNDTNKILVTVKINNKRKFIMNTTFSSENLAWFLKDILRDNVDPFIKSQPIPEVNDGPVTVVVALNLNETVFLNNKDTFIHFYAPWCDHCQKLEPIYEELATVLKHEDLAIVKMDATLNDVPEIFGESSYTGLYWLSKNKKSDPVKYEGDRNLESFVNYIAKHATNELNGYDRNGNPKKKIEL